MEGGTERRASCSASRTAHFQFQRQPVGAQVVQQRRPLAFQLCDRREPRVLRRIHPPVGLTAVRDGALVVVADSDRFGVPGAHADLTVINVADALDGRSAIVGDIPAGRFPREGRALVWADAQGPGRGYLVQAVIRTLIWLTR